MNVIKNISTVLIVLVPTTHAFSSDQPPGQLFRVSGKIEGVPDQTIAYLIREYNGDTIASSKTKNGLFNFQGTLANGAEFHSIWLDSNVTKVHGELLFLEPGKLKVQAKISEWPKVTMKGSKVHNDYLTAKSIMENYTAANILINDDYLNRTKLWMTQLDNARQSKDAHEEKSTEFKIDSVKKIFDEKYKIQYELLQQQLKDFVNRHLQSQYTPYLLLTFSSQWAKKLIGEYYGRLSKSVKESYYGIKVKRMLTAHSLELNGNIEDFSAIGSNEQSVSVGDMIGKYRYTLLDFWASWCSPCRMENPNLIDAFKKFHEKGFNIISLTCDKNKSAWKKAIIEDQMEWTQLISLDVNDPLCGLFNIGALPAYFLVDHQGKIVAIDYAFATTSGDLREGKLQKKLSELFNEKYEVDELQYAIKGRVSSALDGDTVYLMEYQSGYMSPSSIGHSIIKDESFQINGTAGEVASRYYLQFHNTQLPIFLNEKPIEVAAIANSFSQGKVSGSEGQEDYRSYQKYMATVWKEWDSLSVLFNKLQSGDTTIKQDELYHLFELNQYKADDVKTKFIKDFRESEFVPFLVLVWTDRNGRPRDKAFKKSIFETLPQNSRSSYYGRKLGRLLEN